MLKKVLFEDDEEVNQNRSELDGNDDLRTVSMKSKDRVDSNLLESERIYDNDSDS